MECAGGMLRKRRCAIVFASDTGFLNFILIMTPP
jgi:hypothetical protein